MIYLGAVHRRDLSSQMKHKAAVSLMHPLSLSLAFIILIVIITEDNTSNERQVSSLQADEQVSPEIDRAFHRRSGR